MGPDRMGRREPSRRTPTVTKVLQRAPVRDIDERHGLLVGSDRQRVAHVGHDVGGRRRAGTQASGT
eukprot:913725-Lingulodinium_polyedra.AAC.1